MREEGEKRVLELSFHSPITLLAPDREQVNGNLDQGRFHHVFIKISIFELLH